MPDTTLAEQVGAIEVECDKLRDVCRGQIKDLKLLRQLNTCLENEVSVIRNAVTQYEEIIHGKDQEIVQLHEQLDTQATRSQQLQTMQATLKEYLLKSEATVLEQGHEISQLVKLNEYWESQHSQMEEAHSAAQEVLSNSQKLEEASALRIHELESEVTRWEAEATRYRSEVGQLLEIIYNQTRAAWVKTTALGAAFRLLPTLAEWTTLNRIQILCERRVRAQLVQGEVRGLLRKVGINASEPVSEKAPDDSSSREKIDHGVDQTAESDEEASGIRKVPAKNETESSERDTEPSISSYEDPKG
ncbi:hypothetical protein G7046_g8364 [Stylonectria norvegica]|nr:hypothetical protein G7046_g8364 [Stylonectria norvegica]